MIGLGRSRRLGPTKNKLAPRPFGEFLIRLFNSLTFLIITKVAQFQFNSLTGPLAQVPIPESQRRFFVVIYFPCFSQATHHTSRLYELFSPAGLKPLIIFLSAICIPSTSAVVRVSHIFKTMLFRSFTRACPNEFPCDKSIKRWSMEIFLWALVIKGVIFLKR